MNSRNIKPTELCHNIHNAKTEFKRAQRKMYVIDLQDKLSRIKSYVNRSQNQLMKGNINVAPGLAKLLDKALEKMDATPLPPLTFDEMDTLDEIQQQSSDEVQLELVSSESEIVTGQHKLINHLCMRQVDISAGRDTILRRHGLRNVSDILFIDNDLANQMAAEATHFTVTLQDQNAVLDLCDELAPLLLPAEPPFPPSVRP